MKKAFEVVMAVQVSWAGRQRIVFVEAESDRDFDAIDDVKRVFARPDIKPEDCPCELIDNVIVSK